MAAYEYDDFWLEFSPRQGGGYDVAARAPDGESSTGAFTLPFTDDQLETAVRTLGYTRAATTRDIGEVTTERRLTAEQLGGQLAGALLSGPTGKLYGQARAAAVAKGRGVRLWLSLGKAPGLLSVPWEFLYLQPTFLASQRKTPIVRFLQTDAPVAPRRIEDKVRILGVVASPEGLPKLNVAEERKRVDDALGKARKNRDVAIDWLDPATPKALRLALQEGEYHILHFVGHSGYVEEGEATNGGGSGGAIFLEREDHTAAQVSDAQLVNLLGDQDSLRLVVLNSCEGARTSVMDPFAGIATSIVALGIPAVVAMQFEISDKAAITFAEELYQSLIARQDPIDVAVAEARKAVFTEVNETEWATPVLFLRNQDGRLFDFAPIVGAAATAAAVVALSGAPTAPGIAAAGPATATSGPASTAGAATAPTGTTTTDRTGGPPGDAPPPSGTAPVWISPSGPVPKAQPTTTRSAAPRPWVIGVIAVAAIALLLGGASAAGLFGGAVATPRPTSASAGTPRTAALAIVPGTTDEWVGPRPKSNRLAVAGGTSTSVTNVSTIVIPAAGVQTAQASVATDLPQVFDFDPVWDPHRNVVAFARFQNGGSQIKYVVPGSGRRPDGVADKGISVKDPIDKDAAAGTRDHAPAWRGDGNLVFSRTRACRPGSGCAEDIVMATFAQRIGDYIVPVQDDPAVISPDWSEVRKVSIDPTNDRRILVTGRNLQAPNRDFGAWVVDLGGARTLLPASGKATYAIIDADGTFIAIERGTVDGWGSFILAWETGLTGRPERIGSDFIMSGLGATAAAPNMTEFAGISASPTGDGRLAVLATDTAANKAATVPVILFLGSNGLASGGFDPKPPTGVSWNTLIALGW